MWCLESVRLFDEFPYAARSWPKPWRVLLKAEVMAQGENPRFVVTSLVGLDADMLYEDIYCTPGQAELFFKVLKNGCKVEALQLSQMDRVERVLVLSMIVA